MLNQKSKKIVHICSCGRVIPPPFNSTIWPKICPSCDRIKRNKALLTRSHQTREKVAKKGCNEAGGGKKRKPPVKWRDKPLTEIIQYVQDKIVNPYIRIRDKTNFGKCISSNGTIKHAGHFFSVGSHPGMRFSIQNIHGQSIHSNMWQSGDLHNYRKGIIKRHGQAYLDELERQERFYKQYGYQLDKFNVILIAETYIYLKENGIWIFRQEEFNELKIKLATKN